VLRFLVPILGPSCRFLAVCLGLSCLAGVLPCLVSDCLDLCVLLHGFFLCLVSCLVVVWSLSSSSFFFVSVSVIVFVSVVVAVFASFFDLEVCLPLPPTVTHLRKKSELVPLQKVLSCVELIFVCSDLFILVVSCDCILFVSCLVS
jgi:hypothetical protein